MIRETTKYLALKEDEPPPKKLITEGDILIKNLSQKQLSTNLNINDYLKHQKQFEKVSEHISLTTCHSGESSLKQFKNIIDKIENIEYLRSAGLENDDIHLLWDYQQNNLDVKYKNVERSVLQSKIKKILDTLQEFSSKFDKKKSIDDENVFNLNDTIKIRSLNDEILLSEKPNSTTTKLLKFAMNNEQRDEISFKTSMDCIKDIERERFSYLDDEILNPEKVQKRIRNINNRINNLQSNLQNENDKINKERNTNRIFVENTKWDIKDPENTQIKEKKPTKIFTCKPQNYYTIKNGEIIKLDEKEMKEKGLEISKHKLTIEEIKKLPRFEKYTLGEPSNVLFIKNLPKSIKEIDLKEIFKDFSEVKFRIMRGRMKGQIFATFPDINQAYLASKSLNGLIMNNKPMVIEYGKKGNV